MGPHFRTVAASCWPRRLDVRCFAVHTDDYETEPGVRVLVHFQRPASSPLGEVILIHGLEGSSESGYARGMAQAALTAGYATHRLNLRGCGASGRLSPHLYHAGLTTDVRAILAELERQRRTPVVLVGYSLGGNVALKLAGELGPAASRWIAGVCAVSTPIDLEACVRRIGEPANRFYQWWFVREMKSAMRRRRRLRPAQFPADDWKGVRSVFEFDDRVTAPHFGFQGALDYYRTQSAVRYLDRIRVPTVLIQAEDDPLIPFRVFRHPAIRSRSQIRLVSTPRGGHLGFLPGPRRCWLEETVLGWMAQVGNETAREAVV